MARTPRHWMGDRWGTKGWWQWSVKRPSATKGFCNGAHPFFWCAMTACVLAAVVAVAVDSKAPGYALNSVAVYRLQVGFVFLLGLYALVILLWLAYRGESFGNVQLPGGIGAELKNPDPDVMDAANDFETFKKKTEDTLANHEASIALLTDIADDLSQADKSR